MHWFSSLTHDDEERLVHGHEHGLHEHLQRGVLPGDGEEPQDDHHVAQGERVLVVEGVVEDDPGHAEDGHQEVAAVPPALPIPVRRERNHLHDDLHHKATLKKSKVQPKVI